MATKSANFPTRMKVAGYKSVEHDALKGYNAFTTSSGDRVANNHPHVKNKNLGVTNESMLKLGRNLARAQNQGD